VFNLTEEKRERERGNTYPVEMYIKQGIERYPTKTREREKNGKRMGYHKKK
jgi:hypothetical protein